MSIAAQRLLAAVIFTVIMTVFGKFWHWVIYDLAPKWAIDAFFYVGMPLLLILNVVLIYRHWKSGGYKNRRKRDYYGLDD